MPRSKTAKYVVTELEDARVEAEDRRRVLQVRRAHPLDGRARGRRGLSHEHGLVSEGRPHSGRQASRPRHRRDHRLLRQRRRPIRTTWGVRWRSGSRTRSTSSTERHDLRAGGHGALPAGHQSGRPAHLPFHHGHGPPVRQDSRRVRRTSSGGSRPGWERSRGDDRQESNDESGSPEGDRGGRGRGGPRAGCRARPDQGQDRLRRDLRHRHRDPGRLSSAWSRSRSSPRSKGMRLPGPSSNNDCLHHRSLYQPYRY